MLRTSQINNLFHSKDECLRVFERLKSIFGVLTEPSEPIVSPAGEQPSSSEKIKKELQRRNSRPTVERTSPKLHRLRRQSTILDEFGTKRRGSKYVFAVNADCDH